MTDELQVDEIIYTVEDLLEISDKLLTNLNEKLLIEFDAGRIVGTQYADVYIASINAAMQQAQAFLLAKDRAGYEAEIAREQSTQAMHNTEISEGTKQDKIDLSGEQLQQAEQQTIAITNDTYVNTETKDDRVDLVRAQLEAAQNESNLSKEQYTVLRERHGMNYVPEYTQGVSTK